MHARAKDKAICAPPGPPGRIGPPGPLYRLPGSPEKNERKTERQRGPRPPGSTSWTSAPSSASTRRSAAATGRKSGSAGSVITCGGTRRPRSSPRRTGEVVGFMLGEVRSGEFGLEEPTGWIEVLGVDPGHRGARRSAGRWPRPCWSTSGAGAPTACSTLVDEEMGEIQRLLQRPRLPARDPETVRPAPCKGLVGEQREMSVKTTTLPKPFHDAVLRWKDAYLPDYEFLLENWEKHFPREPRFELCAYRELGMCTEIECGDMKGKPKFTRAGDMHARAGASPLRRHPRPGLDRVRLHPAAPPDPRPRPGRGGAVLDPPHDGRGAAPRLPDAPPAGRGRLELASPRSRPRTWSRTSCR